MSTLQGGRVAWKFWRRSGGRVACRAGAAAASGRQDRPGRRAVAGAGLAAVLVHDRGWVLADLACAVADGARVISDFRVMGDQRELFGLVASVPTAWRTLEEIAGGGTRADERITAAVNTARRHAWAQVAARHGALPGVRLADKILDGVACIRLDATVTVAHSDKELAEANFKGYRPSPLGRRRVITPAGSRWPGCCAAARRAEHGR